MGGFSVLSANHTSFTVSDLDRSVGFFCDALGFALLSKAPRDAAIIRKITGVDGADIIVAYVEGPGGHRIELIEYLAPADRRKVLRIWPITWMISTPLWPRPRYTAFNHWARPLRLIRDPILARASSTFVTMMA